MLPAIRAKSGPAGGRRHYLLPALDDRPVLRVKADALFAVACRPQKKEPFQPPGKLAPRLPADRAIQLLCSRGVQRRELQEMLARNRSRVAD
jgi:hypothetical protein